MENEAATLWSKILMFSGFGTAGVGWYNITEWMGVLGGVSAFLGMLATFWYSRKGYKLKERELQARLDGLIS
jgi:hypothetical protein